MSNPSPNLSHKPNRTFTKFKLNNVRVWLHIKDSEYHTQLGAKMSLDEIFDLTAVVVVYFHYKNIKDSSSSASRSRYATQRRLGTNNRCAHVV